MHKLLVLVMVAGAGFGFYKFNRGDVDHPVHTYRKFMTHLRATEIGEARRYAHGDVVEDDIKAYQRHEADRYRVRGSMTIQRAIFRVESSYQDGDVTVFDIVEELRTDPPGTHSSMGSVNVWLRHEVAMQPINGEWKVVGFSYEFENAEGVDGVDVDDADRWF